MDETECYRSGDKRCKWTGANCRAFECQDMRDKHDCDSLGSACTYDAASKECKPSSALTTSVSSSLSFGLGPFMGGNVPTTNQTATETNINYNAATKNLKLPSGNFTVNGI